MCACLLVDWWIGGEERKKLRNHQHTAAISKITRAGGVVLFFWEVCAGKKGKQKKESAHNFSSFTWLCVCVFSLCANRQHRSAVSLVRWCGEILYWLTTVRRLFAFWCPPLLHRSSSSCSSSSSSSSSLLLLPSFNSIYTTMTFWTPLHPPPPYSSSTNPTLKRGKKNKYIPGLEQKMVE